MNVILEGTTDLQTRNHPYDGAKYDPRVRHYDFVKEPHLIRQALEDFKRWKKYEAVERFYQFLEWINGAESVFETSDCRLEPPKNNPHKQIQYKRCLFGRVMVFFRELAFNYAEIFPNNQYFVHKHLQDLCTDTVTRLRSSRKQVVATTQIFLAPTYYLTGPENPFGHQVMFQFNCFGNDEKTLFREFGASVDILAEALKAANTQWQQQRVTEQ
jgi:hypothetical protein